MNMSAYLWKVTTKKQVGKLPAGASVEIVKNNKSGKPTQKEINAAFDAKYGVDLGGFRTSKNNMQLQK